MTLSLRVPATLSALALLMLGGCGQPAPTTSTLTGSIAQQSFAVPVKAITVTSDQGKTTKAAVGANGEFSISLEKGATYRLFLGDDGKSTPVILNSAQGQLVTTAHVRSGGANVNIGSVRFWQGDASAPASVPPLDPSTSSNVVPTTPPTVTPQCVNGLVEGSTKPCATDTAAASCADAEEGDDGEHAGDGDGEHADDSAATGGECVDGTNSVTHQPCDGGPAANQDDGESADGPDQASLADPTQAMGIPEHNVATDLGCDEEDDGDDEEKDD